MDLEVFPSPTLDVGSRRDQSCHVTKGAAVVVEKERRMPEIPHDSWPESTIVLLHNPYRFISERYRRYRSDLFERRILLQPSCTARI